MSPGVFAGEAVISAAILDWMIGDPRRSLHPVVVMGWVIQCIRTPIEQWAKDWPWRLRLGGGVITSLLVIGSGLMGWAIERLIWTATPIAWVGWLIMVIGLASALAGRSLHHSVMAILHAIPATPKGNLDDARDKLSWIVGRDVQDLDRTDILRAATESAAENAVDGLFAPLFWMCVGTSLWQMNPIFPGPLALAWAFKASSTLDSMLGYRTDNLQWLGTAGARLDDLLTWLPCRLVMLTLPVVSYRWSHWLKLIQAAEQDGKSDPSPNAGRSEAIYAHCVGVKLGGNNRYGQRWINKPILAKTESDPDIAAVSSVLNLTVRLEILWLVALFLVSQ